MAKFKTATFLVASLLSLSMTQAMAADNDTNYDSEVSSLTNTAWIDFSDPTAVYSKIGLGSGTEGVDVYASLGGYLTGRFEQRLTVEGIHDMDYVNVDYFVFNRSSETGFSLDSRWDSEYNEIVGGVVKKLIFVNNKALRVFPAMKFGIRWGLDNSVESTNFVELEVATRYNITPDFWVGITPSYRYYLDDEDTDGFGGENHDLTGNAEIGYQLAEEVAVSVHGNNDHEYWGVFTFAF